MRFSYQGGGNGYGWSSARLFLYIYPGVSVAGNYLLHLLVGFRNLYLEKWGKLKSPAAVKGEG